MKRLNLFIISSFIFIVFVSAKEGNIIKINIEDSSFTELYDIVWQESDTSYQYIAAFSVDSNSYLIKWQKLPYDPEGPIHQNVGLNSIVNIKNNSSTLYLRIGNFIRFIGFVLYPPYFYKMDSGLWIFSDIQGKAFVSNTDSITTFFDDNFYEHRLIHISGKIESDYIAVLLDLDSENVRYYLNDLKDMPDYDIDQFRELYINKDDILASQIINIFNDTYILNDNYNFTLHIAIYKNDTLFVKDELNVNQYFDKWIYKNNALFLINGESLFKYDLSMTDTTFTNERLLASGKFAIDFNNLLSAQIINDSLFITDLENEIVTKKISLDSIKYFSVYKPVIDYPNVYLHQIEAVSSLNESQEKPTKLYLFQNFPNPFNNTTTIKYHLSKTCNIKLSIYSILGQEVATLVNKNQMAGTYKVDWDAASLSSGLYFYRLVTNIGVVQTKKLVLLK